MSLLLVIQAIREDFEATGGAESESAYELTNLTNKGWSGVPWPPRPAELADWPIPWRQRWGDLANEFQDQGVPWPDHERLAFDQIRAEMMEAS